MESGNLSEIILPPHTEAPIEISTLHKKVQSSYFSLINMMPDQQISDCFYYAFGGFTNDPKNENAFQIFVIMQQGIYKYDILSHSLKPHKKGNFKEKSGLNFCVKDANLNVLIFQKRNGLEYRETPYNKNTKVFFNDIEAINASYRASIYAASQDLAFKESFQFDIDKMKETLGLDQEKEENEKEKVEHRFVISFSIGIKKPEKEGVNFIKFSSNSEYILMGTKIGYKIFKNSNPITLECDSEFEGGVKLFEILSTNTFFGIVPTGDNPNYPNTMVVFKRDKSAQELKCDMKVPVLNVVYKEPLIFIVTQNKISYSKDLQKFEKIETFDNPLGLFTVSREPSTTIISYPYKKNDNGQHAIKLKEINESKNSNLFENEIFAHDNKLACIKLNNQGSLVATASEKGTLIRVFKVIDGALIQILRRGKNPAEIYSIDFHDSSAFLAVYSSSGTVHLFHVKRNDNEETKNTKSTLSSWLPGFIGNKIANEEYSFTKLTIRSDKLAKGDAKLSGNKNEIIISTINGDVINATYQENSTNQCEMSPQYFDIFNKVQVH